MDEIISRDDLYREMSEKSLEFVQQHDINNVLESFEKLYHAQTGISLPANKELIMDVLVDQ